MSHIADPRDDTDRIHALIREVLDDQAPYLDALADETRRRWTSAERMRQASRLTLRAMAVAGRSAAEIRELLARRRGLGLECYRRGWDLAAEVRNLAEEAEEESADAIIYWAAEILRGEEGGR